MSRVLIVLLLFSFYLNASLFDFKNIWAFENSYKSKDYKKALYYLNKIKKDTPAINYNKANTLYKLKRYKEALKFYKRAHGEDVNEIDRLFNIGNTFFKLKEYDNAIFTYKLILKYRDDKDVKHNLKLTYLKKLEALKQKQKPGKKTKKRTKKSKDKKSNQKSKKIKKKLSKKELLELKKLKEKEQLKRELKRMLKKSLKDKKVPVLMYKIDGQNIKSSKNLKPW